MAEHIKGNPYVKEYLFSASNYYIHEHAENIGRANLGNAMTQGQLVSFYSEKRQAALDAAKQQYRNLFKASIIKNQTSSEGITLINEALEDDNIMKEINDQMGKRLSQVLAVDKLASLMQKEIQADKTDFKKIINSDALVEIEAFNNILEALAGASQLIRNQTLGKRLAFYLTHIFNSKTGVVNRQEAGIKLQEQLKKFKDEVNGSQLNNFDIQQIESIQNSLNTLVRALKTDKTGKKDKEMTADGIRKLIQNIFNTGFAQVISGQIKKNAYISIMGGLKNVKFTGNEKTQIAFTDTLGQFQKFIGSPSYGKADVIFPNVKIKLEKQGTENNAEINISIGISDKFYKGAKFPGVKEIKKSDGTISSGGGGKVTDILQLIFGNDIRSLYLSYNTLAHGPNISSAQEALQDIMLKRNLVYSFAARGQSDFAQFMFINGQIVPIWDIILSAEQFVGKSASVLKGQQKTPIYLTMQKREDMLNLMRPNPIDDEFTRVLKVNQAIRALKIKIELNLNALIRQGGNVFSKY